MADILELERRVAALEAAQNDTTQTLRWVVTKLAQMSALQTEHTLRLERIESDVKALRSDTDELKADMREVKTDIKSLRRDLPAMMAETMREVLREQKGGAS
jgi:chromosome segregation ATPase